MRASFSPGPTSADSPVMLTIAPILMGVVFAGVVGATVVVGAAVVVGGFAEVVGAGLEQPARTKLTTSTRVNITTRILFIIPSLYIKKSGFIQFLQIVSYCLSASCNAYDAGNHITLLA
jgi:uncharacterized membrane protein